MSGSTTPQLPDPAPKMDLIHALLPALHFMLYMLPFVIVIGLMLLLMTLPLRSGRRNYSQPPTVLKIVKIGEGATAPTKAIKIEKRPVKPATRPIPQFVIGAVPEHIGKLIERIRTIQPSIKNQADRDNLSAIRDKLKVYYTRHVKLGASNSYTAVLEEKLRILTEMLDRYVDIQDHPEYYTFGDSDDKLYLTKDLSAWTASASRAISSYLNLLYAAIRDDSKMELAALDMDIDNLVNTSGNTEAPRSITPGTPRPPSALCRARAVFKSRTVGDEW